MKINSHSLTAAEHSHCGEEAPFGDGHVALAHNLSVAREEHLRDKPNGLCNNRLNMTSCPKGTRDENKKLKGKGSVLHYNKEMEGVHTRWCKSKKVRKRQGERQTWGEREG